MSIPLPKLSRRKRGWVSGDPPVSAGRSVSQRKSARDGGLTPTERHKKNALMRQFMRNPEGGGTGNSPAYRESALWCSHPGCKRSNGTHSHGKCLCEWCTALVVCPKCHLLDVRHHGLSGNAAAAPCASQTGAR